MRERICPACGEKVTDERARFCPMCAAALPELSAEETVAALEEALRGCYQDYNAWVILTRSGEGFGKRLLELVIGSSAFKSSEKHTEFFAAVGDASAALLSAYRAAPGAGDPAGLLRYVLLDCHDAVGQDADWMLQVAEQHFVDFPALLSPEAAGALYADYRQVRKQLRGFDFQQQILKSLKQRSRA